MDHYESWYTSGLKEEDVQQGKKRNLEEEFESVTGSAKRLRNGEEMSTDVQPNINYRILDFFIVFTAISCYVKCKTCNGDIKFQIADERGLGFKILLHCNYCPSKVIDSCTLISDAYEINRRFIFTLRILGIGLQGAKKFCALMDLPAKFGNFYNSIMKNIRVAASEVCIASFKRSVREEYERTTQLATTTNRQIEGLTAFRNDTWSKDGFFAYVVIEIIGYYSKKILQSAVIKYFCEECQEMKHLKGTAEYENWLYHHKCILNEEELKSIAIRREMELLKMSMEAYDTKYVNYITDSIGHNEIIKNSEHYGNDIIIKLKQCINMAKKRMVILLQNCKEAAKLDGEDILTKELIDKLTYYYGLAISTHKDSIENMHNAIWATYYHKCSTDNKPQHQYCPQGEDSWCKWQQAKARGDIGNFKHQKELYLKIQEALKPIYEELTQRELLEMCVGAFTRNGTFNSLIWKIAPLHPALKEADIFIAACISTCIYNYGFSSLLQIMNILNINIGLTATEYCNKLDQLDPVSQIEYWL